MAAELSRVLLGQTLLAWLIAAACMTLVAGFLYAARHLARRRMRIPRAGLAPAAPAHNVVLAILADLRDWFIVVCALHVSAGFLSLPDSLSEGLRFAIVVALVLQGLLASRLLIDSALDRLVAERRREDGSPDVAVQSATGVIRFFALFAATALLLVLLLSNIGIEVTPLVTGLGIGGIAIALAAQALLGDLLGSLTILFDRPFLVGDFIIVGSSMGTVEHIGVKTTRLRALSGEQLVFSNTQLLGDSIQNFQRMQERRVVQTLAVPHDTPVPRLREIPAVIAACVSRHAQLRLDRAHLRGFAPYAIDFEYVYYVASADYNCHMDLQQRVHLDLLEALQARDIALACPTQIEILRSAPAPAARRMPVGVS